MIKVTRTLNKKPRGYEKSIALLGCLLELIHWSHVGEKCWLGRAAMFSVCFEETKIKNLLVWVSLYASMKGVACEVKRCCPSNTLKCAFCGHPNFHREGEE